MQLVGRPVGFVRPRAKNPAMYAESSGEVGVGHRFGRPRPALDLDDRFVITSVAVTAISPLPARFASVADASAANRMRICASPTHFDAPCPHGLGLPSASTVPTTQRARRTRAAPRPRVRSSISRASRCRRKDFLAVRSRAFQERRRRAFRMIVTNTDIPPVPNDPCEGTRAKGTPMTVTPTSSRQLAVETAELDVVAFDVLQRHPQGHPQRAVRA